MSIRSRKKAAKRDRFKTRGKVFQNLRTSNSMSEVDFGESLGLSLLQVKALEDGRIMSVELAWKLCRKFGVCAMFVGGVKR